ncbi:glyoxylate reductase/hydroxypyruvate reductase isoform X2 [Diabrotica virgifera virgifera]|uniref:Glyoxylate reductase/hydroxypyruvate reductase-like n=2 Tax=Diabrotica virgifera virgifera TaxID=50390 RepID=A0ABM5KVR0_DIAVI|nr:glyoxylate reductase/hydroxypyruvate reductase isoform X2 [Diabrotica virgifera virgifera]
MTLAKMNLLRIGLLLFFVISFSSVLGKARQSKMNNFKVLVTNPTVPDSGITLLNDNGCNVTQLQTESRENILKNVRGMDALFWASGIKLDSEVLDAAGPQLKTIGLMSAGYNHVDVEELRKRGIRMGNTPKVLNDAVADIAILLTLAASRRLHEARLSIENGNWVTNDWAWMCGQDITNSTVGIIGLGHIGQTIARRLKGFDIQQLLYTGHKEKKEGIELGAKFVSLNTLLEDSDFVIMVVPLTTETHHMCNEEFFSKMKKTAVFINVSRGEVVDQPALINALKRHTIFAAGLDVMTPEPLPSNHELLTLPNVVLMPHLGSATIETRQSMSTLTAQNILRGLAGEEMLTPVV